MNQQLAVATILDPRFRNLYFENVDTNNAIQYLRNSLNIDSSSSDSETDLAVFQQFKD